MYAATGELIATAPVLILANAVAARSFAPSAHLALHAARGQVAHLNAAPDSAPQVVVSRLGYVTPAINGVRSSGASFVMDDADTSWREAEHVDNLHKLNCCLPAYLKADELAEACQAAAATQHSENPGRVGIRPIAPDRLPMIGQIADLNALDPKRPIPALAKIPRLPGLYITNAFGARGLVWSAFAGELLASMICGEPLPVEKELCAALDPARFLLSGKAN